MAQIRRVSSVYGRGEQLIRKFTSPGELRPLVRMALEEDLGDGDLTACVFPRGMRDRAVVVCKGEGVLSGSYVFDLVFRELHRGVQVNWRVADGARIGVGEVLATVTGPVWALLQGERVALNFLQRLCGIASYTSRMVDVVGRGKGRPGVFDTRKTTPLWRALEKRAVLDGGGQSHRFGLYDMAMLKDNHIDAAGGIREAVARLGQDNFFRRRPRAGLCIEVRSVEEAVEATVCMADIIMLDNMSPGMVRRAARAVRLEAERLRVAVPELEVSGGITLRNVRRFAGLPVQRISVGSLTHSVESLDISMRFSGED